jgi:hypothetical protein
MVSSQCVRRSDVSSTGPADDPVGASTTQDSCAHGLDVGLSESWARIIAAGDERDPGAGARDLSSDRRDVAVNLRAFLPPDDNDGGDHAARWAAQRDRSDSRSDRASSAASPVRAHWPQRTGTDVR